MSAKVLANAVILLVYVLLVASLVGGMRHARARALAASEVPEVLADWEVWRAEAERQRQGAGPVRRREPAAEPPTLVLLRDHYGTSLTVLLVLSSAVYFAVAALIRGVCTAPAFHPDFKS